MIPGRWNAELYRGDSFVKTFEFTDGDGAAIDLSLYTPAMKLHRYGAVSSEDPVSFLDYFSTGDMADGILSLEVPPTITAELLPGTYLYDIELATVGRNVVKTYLAGAITVLEDTTINSYAIVITAFFNSADLSDADNSGYVILF